MAKTITLVAASFSFDEKGVTLDFSTNSIVIAPASFGATSVSSVSNFDPLTVTTLNSYEGFDFEYQGSIAVTRVGTSTLIGSNYHANYTQTIDLANTTITSILPLPFTSYASFSIAFGAAISYASIAGQLIGAVIEDGDHIVGSSLPDTIKMTDRDERVSGGAGNDWIYGRGGNDTIDGGTGNDFLDGGIGTDKMSGGSGNDTFVVDNKSDRTIESAGQGTDTVKSSISFALAANLENLTLLGASSISATGNSLGNALMGNSGRNTLDGGKGNDTLKGGAGNDKLIGGIGADKFVGGSGADSFVFNSIKDSTVSASGRDKIYDFSRTQGDKINLKTIDANTKSVGDQKFKFIGDDAFHKKPGELRYEKKGGDTYIYCDVNGDGKADFSILFDAKITFVKGDFIL